MSDLDAFEAKVRKNIKLLSAPDAKTRRESAAWLGEAGDPSAITRLRQLYEEDPDKGVRRTAAYSLGMFRALEAGLNGPHQEEVVQRLEDIALKGKIGSRSGIPAGPLVKIILGLVVSLAILLAFNFVVWPQFGGEIAGLLGVSAVSAPPELQARVQATHADTDTLRGQYLNVLGGGSVDCASSFRQPAPFAVGDAGDFSEAVATLNSAIVDLNSAKAPFEQACAPGAAALTATDITPSLGTLGAAQEKLSAVATTLGLVAANDPAPPVTTAPQTAPEEAVLEPEVEAEAEVTAEAPTPVPNVRPAVVSLLDLIDDMQTTRGPTALLNQYWADIRDTGSTDGCTLPVPAIPEQTALPADLDGLSDDLDLAVGLVNNGLALTRQGWNQLTAACASANPREAVEGGLLSARNASGAFDLAREQLNPLVAN